MRDYVITTDNNSDLPESYYQEHGVGCTYLSYAMDGVNYTHDNFLPDHEFYDRMRNGSLPTTAQVNPENVKKLMEPLPERRKRYPSYCFFFRLKRKLQQHPDRSTGSYGRISGKKDHRGRLPCRFSGTGPSGLPGPGEKRSRRRHGNGSKMGPGQP